MCGTVASAQEDHPTIPNGATHFFVAITTSLIQVTASGAVTLTTTYGPTQVSATINTKKNEETSLAERYI